MEDVLVEAWATEQLVSCFVEAKTASFDTIVERYLRLFRLSPTVASKVTTSSFVRRLVERLGRTTRPVVRLSLLKIARVVIEDQPSKASLLRRCGVLEVVDRLARQDEAVLVRELAKELAKDLIVSVAAVARSKPEPCAHRQLLWPSRSRPAKETPKCRPGSTFRRAASESSSITRSDTRERLAPPAPPVPPPMPAKPTGLALRRPLQPSPPIGGQRPPTPTPKRKTSRALADIRWVEGRDGQIKPTSSTRRPV